MAAYYGPSLHSQIMRGGDLAALTHIHPVGLGLFRHEYSTPACQFPWSLLPALPRPPIPLHPLEGPLSWEIDRQDGLQPAARIIG